MKVKGAKMSTDEEIILMCAFRYALGRMTYVVSVVCDTLKSNYTLLSPNFKAMVAKEIREYQEVHGSAGMDFDNTEWNAVKWLFDETNRVEIDANMYGTEGWVSTTAIKGEDGRYYSIPEVKEFFKIKIK